MAGEDAATGAAASSNPYMAGAMVGTGFLKDYLDRVAKRKAEERAQAAALEQGAYAQSSKAADSLQQGSQSAYQNMVANLNNVLLSRKAP